VLRLAETIALYHHERWDGTGYGSLQGAETPLMARIVAVVDVFDGLTHPRPYRDAWSVPNSVAYIRDGAGSAFDPAVVTAFLEVLPKIPPEFFEPQPSPLSADAAPEEEPGTALPQQPPA
jgi:putative two-component system response regulator